jgi:hypothetical protein
MTVLALFYSACEAVFVAFRPAPGAWGLCYPERRPGATVLRMLKNAAILAHIAQRGLETAIVIAYLLRFALGDIARLSPPKTAPTLTGRVRDNRVRASVGPGVSRFVIRIDTVNPGVRAIADYV